MSEPGCPRTERARRALRRARDAGTFELPPLPAIAQRVISLAADPDAGAAALATLVHRDPALAAQVLRAANSAALSGGARIVSLQQAVTRLGIRRVAEIALAASMRRDLFGAPRFAVQLERLFRHAVASGLWAKEIARTRRDNVEGAFLCGLLHRIGQALVLRNLDRLAGSDPLAPGDLAGLTEEFETDFGSALAAAWQLPPAVQAAIAHARQPERADAHGRDALVAALAGRLAESELPGSPPDQDEQLRGLTGWAALGIYPEHVEEILARRREIHEAVEACTG